MPAAYWKLSPSRPRDCLPLMPRACWSATVGGPKTKTPQDSDLLGTAPIKSQHFEGRYPVMLVHPHFEVLSQGEIPLPKDLHNSGRRVDSNSNTFNKSPDV